MPDAYPRPSSVSEYTVLLEGDLPLKEWHELTELCRRLGVSTYSTPAQPILFNVFVREEDKDLLG